MNIRLGKRRSENLVNKHMVIRFIYFFTLLSVVIYIVNYMNENIRNQNIYNIIIFIMCGMIVLWSLKDALKRGFQINTIFGISYFFFMALAQFHISGLQEEKSLYSLYYLFAGSLAFLFVVRLFENQKCPTIRKLSAIDADFLALFLFFFSTCLKIIIFLKMGTRLTNADFASGVGNSYTISGVSGLAEMTMWLSLMCLPNIKRRNKILVFVGSFILFGVFSLSRNNMMMLIVFLTMYFLYSKGEKILRRPDLIIKMLILIIFVFEVFSMFGVYRQTARGWNNPNETVKKLLMSSTNNSVINWVYSYTSINYDVMLQVMAKAAHPYTCYGIFLPILRLVGASSAIAAYNDRVFHIHGLNGFNASTFFGPLIFEMGEFYFFGALLLAVQVGIFAYFARMEKTPGHTIYLMTWAALSVFGNNYTIVIYHFTSIAACILFGLINVKKKNDADEGII